MDKTIYTFTPKPSPNKLDCLVFLRGIAVMMVCFCHFGNALVGTSIFSGLFLFFKDYGKFGVHIFFVISGFVIPFSLFKGKYSIVNYHRFLYKRLLRLHPPYLAALLLTIVIMFFSYKLRHIAFPETTKSILRSIFYLHIPGDNPVFWTLVVEAEYYIFIGLFYELLMKQSKIAYLIFIPAIILLSYSFLSGSIALLPYIIFFFIGNVTYMVYIGDSKKLFSSFVLIILLLVSAFFYEFPAFITSVFTVITILFFRKTMSPAFKFIGIISYSLYLTHFPIGIKFLNLVKHNVSPSNSWIFFIAANMICILVAWGFYKIFEEFSERLSKDVKYK